MGMEPINSISSIQAQTTMRPVATPKVSNDVVEGTANNVTVPKIDNTTVAVSKSQENGGNKGTFGKLRLVCGSERYRGAASLALSSALRSGVMDRLSAMVKCSYR